VNKKTIPFKEYSEGTPCLIDIDTCPPHIRTDYFRRNENIEKGAVLCEHCDGTGNEFMSMYHKCPKCEGTGVQS
jgi:RecJ-like exonuclease